MREGGGWVREVWRCGEGGMEPVWCIQVDTHVHTHAYRR